ncbi:MAG: DUF6502 family protein [Pseudomonadota bacterium]
MAELDRDTPSSTFARVLKGLLRPLVKAMIAHGLTLPAVYRMLKQLYVEVAETEFGLEGRKPTDSRIHVLTGVHRKDIRAIREAGYEDASVLRTRVAAISGVVGQWLGDPATTDAQGNPLPLPRTAESGPSFETLAASVSRDARPRTLLDELLRQGLVSVDLATDTVTLDARAVVGPSELNQKVHFFVQNVGDHITAATENLIAEDTPPFLERAVFYNYLRPESVDTLEESARSLGNDVLTRLNRDALALQRADEDDGAARERFRFGVFFYRASEGEQPTVRDGEGGDNGA